MITNKDRSRWIGASDTHIVMGRWDTTTFEKWWLVKLGVITDTYTNKYMEFGNIVEHAIIDAIDPSITKGRRPVYVRKYQIRANYDGLLPDRVVEIKTTKDGFGKLPAAYYGQCQALMLACKRDLATVYAYRVDEDEYDRPYFLSIFPERISAFDVERDEGYLEEYVRRCLVLKQAMKRRKWPCLPM